jgi:flavin reductase (DIM6/NTAB) family NADH-FMN oxidoreductase RutF
LIVEVDLTGAPTLVRLADPAHFGAFHVRVLAPSAAPDWEALATVLDGLARVEADSAYVEVTAIEELAGERAEAEQWRAGLGEMVAYAQSKGWLDDSGAIAAHVEWEPEVAIAGEDFRHVLGHYPTGVAVVTAERPDGPVGMACNSFTSVSLEPPLIAVCPAKSSETWPEIRDAGRFLVNLMHRDHEALVREFARKGADRFASVDFHPHGCGPALDDALAWIGCSLYAEHDAGDHTIALGRVMGLQAREDLEPLVFFRGRYGTFSGHGDQAGSRS